MNKNIRTSVEPLGAVKMRQMLWVDWMKQASAGLSDDDLVMSVTQITPFGSYLLHFERAEEQAS